MDRFVVDLEIRTAQEILPRWRTPDEREHVLHGTRDNSRLCLVSAKRERLAGRGLSVGENDCVVALHRSVNVRTCDS
jgi:hypothetical protein